MRRAPWLAVISLARWSAFGALGARKSWRAKFLPVTLTLIAFLPAFAVLAIRAIAGPEFSDRFPELIPYRQYLTEIGLDVTIFAAILCPELLCPDRRDNVLSLYLSTAVGRFTYVAGKVIAAIVPLLGLTLLPVLLLFLGNTFFADSALNYLGDHWSDLLRIFASGILLASYVSLLGLAVASFTSRRAFALGGYAALMLIPTYVGGALVYRRRARPALAADHARAAADRSCALALPGRWRPGDVALRLVVVGGLRGRHGGLVGLPVVALPEGRRLTLVFDGVSKWYGDTVALAEVSFELAPGVTGLLGHNGAGKSTALALCAGFADPSTGTVRVLGHDPRREPGVYRRIGIVHDRDGLWPFLTARELVELMAGLRDVPDPAAAAAEALASVGLEDAAERRVGGFSKGMRQRVKLAQALVHDPELLLLDEPLNGLDPVQRRHVVELIRRLGSEGRTVLVSSHVLHEVERMAPRVVVLVNGRLVAEGETGAIRDLIRDRPRTLRIDAGGAAQALARELVGEGLASGVRLDDGVLVVETAEHGRARPAR